MGASRAPVAHACNPRYSGGRDQEDHSLKPAWENSPQYPTQNRAGKVVQVVEHLPHKFEAWSSNPLPPKINK
jgi:hypothetical protein